MENKPKKKFLFLSARHYPVGDYPGLKLCSWLFFIYLYAPILVLFVYSFNMSTRAQIWRGFSFQWYERVFANDNIQQATLNSLMIATIATGLAVTFATLAALTLARSKNFKFRTASMGIITLPLVVPEIATAVATLSFFSLIGFSLGLTSVIIAHTVFCIPFAFLPIRARLEGVDQALEQAGRDLYANEWQTFRYITLPLLMPGILAGAMLAFIISLDDFIITLMVSGAGSTTLPVYIYSMIRVGLTPEVNAVSSILLAFSIIFITAYWLFTKRN